MSFIFDIRHKLRYVELVWFTRYGWTRFSTVLPEYQIIFQHPAVVIIRFGRLKDVKRTLIQFQEKGTTM